MLMIFFLSLFLGRLSVTTSYLQTEHFNRKNFPVYAISDLSHMTVAAATS